MIDLKIVFLIYTNLLMQHESRKCWDIFKIEIKWKLKDFQLTWANMLFPIEHK